MPLELNFKNEVIMIVHFPPPAALIYPVNPDSELLVRLKTWNPDLNWEKLELVRLEPRTWNNGSLGCPIEGHYYTQALVPGYLIVLQIEERTFEVHTNEAMSVFAIPGVGFI